MYFTNPLAFSLLLSEAPDRILSILGPSAALPSAELCVTMHFLCPTSLVSLDSQFSKMRPLVTQPTVHPAPHFYFLPPTYLYFHTEKN